MIQHIQYLYRFFLATILMDSFLFSHLHRPAWCLDIINHWHFYFFFGKSNENRINSFLVIIFTKYFHPKKISFANREEIEFQPKLGFCPFLFFDIFVLIHNWSLRFWNMSVKNIKFNSNCYTYHF